MEYGAAVRIASRKPPAHALGVPSVRSVMVWTPADYARAVREADTGNTTRLADFAAWAMTDGRVAGVLDQRTTGMLALPSRYEPISPEIEDLCAHWQCVFPEAEQAACLAWGLVIGTGIARVETAYTGGEWHRTIRTWHGRHFAHDEDGRIWAETSAGRREVIPGEGWIVFRPFGDHQPWLRALVHRVAVPVLAKAYAVDDRTRSGEVTPILVAKTQGLSEPQRRTFLADLAGLAQDSRVVLPEGCDLTVVDRTGQQSTIHGETIAWADTEITIGLAGQKVTTEGAPGFSAGGAQQAILHSILRHQEETWSTTVGEQGLTPWLALVAGYAGPIVYPRWDVSDPAGTTAKAYAATQLGAAIAAIDATLAADGVRVNARVLAEQTGLPIIPLTSRAERPSVALAPTDIVSVISVNEARASAGLGALAMSDGVPDPRGTMSVAAYRAELEASGGPAPPTAAEGPGLSPASTEPLGAEADPPPPTDSATYAQQLTDLGVDRCWHGRVTQCPQCGVVRVPTVERDASGEVVHPIRWRALGAAEPHALALGARVETFGATALAVGAPLGDAPPDRFLLFSWGDNATDKGTVIMDREGAAEAIAAMGSRPLVIDLEHLSLDPSARHYDPDARGHANVEIDDVGVWATNVKWTADGARRIRERTQRFTSPAVKVDRAGRVVRLVNAALVAQPATLHIAPLIAASKAAKTMDDETLLITLRVMFGLKPDASNDEIAAAASEALTGRAPPKDPQPAAEATPAPEVPMGATVATSATVATPATSATVATPAGLDDAALAALARGLFAAADNETAAAALRGASSAAVALSATTIEREREEIIRAHARKFSPAQIEWAKTQTPAALRAFARFAPDLTTEHLRPAPSGAEAVDDADAALCRMFGTDPKIVAEIRARETR